MAVYLPNAEPSADNPVKSGPDPSAKIEVNVENPTIEAEVIVAAEQKTESIDYAKYWAEGPEVEEESVEERQGFRRRSEERHGNHQLLTETLLISGENANSDTVLLRKNIEAILIDIPHLRNRGEVEVLSLSSGNGKIPMDGAVLVWEYESVKYFYGFLVEGSGSQKKEWFTHVGELYDQAAIEEIKRLIGGTSNEVGYATLTPEEINESDSANVLRTAVTLALNSLWNQIHTPPLLTPEVIGHKILVNPKEFPESHSTNAIGRPIRTDVQLDMKVQDRNSSHKLGSPKFWVDLAVDDGFIQPTVRISDLGDMASYSLENVLLSVAGVALCNQDENWRSAFIGRKYNKLNDLAGLGYFIDDKKAETKAMSYGDDYEELLDVTCFPQGMIAIDVPEASPLTWLLRHLVREPSIESGFESGFEAHDLILEAANNLTGGQFSYLLGGEEFPFLYEGYRSLSGHYVAKNGDKRSLDDVDAIALVNSSKDLESAVTWGHTADAFIAPEEERLIHRERLIKAVLPGAVITGVNRVVYFNPVFIDLLLEALQYEGVRFIHDEGQRPSGRHSRFTPSHFRGFERRSAGQPNRLFS